jgi:hypothetical protein
MIEQTGINPDLERAISDLLAETMKDSTASLTDKMKVIDRALNLEKIRQKLNDESWGAAVC